MRIFKLLLTAFLLALYSGVSSQDLSVQINNLEQTLKVHQSEIERLSAKADSLKLLHIMERLEKIGWPSEGEVIKHNAMALVYDEAHEMARWVAHIILPEVKDGRTTRTNDFRVDPKIKTGSAEEKDYFLKQVGPDGKMQYDGFGFDRGHLAPSADFRWNQQALSESYYYSNMTPQRPEFNRESWATIEDYVRDYAIRNQAVVYVVTGPVLHDKLPKVERSVNNVSIPELHYKVAIDLDNMQSVAFLMPNGKCEAPMESYIKTIDEVEQLTGLNFFPNLSPEQEKKLEAALDYEGWLPGGDNQTKVRMLRPDELEKGQYNTLKAYEFADTGKKVTICGTVVSTFKSKKNNVFLNLDRRFPNSVFSVNIWSSNMQNFPYKPEVELMDRKICIKGEVKLRDGVPNMNCESDKQITFLDEL